MTPTPFAPAQTATLLDLRKGLPEVRTVLVGAAALACQMDMRWRKTNDLDLTVVAEEADLATRLRDLSWDRHPRYEQRWTSRQGVVVDALPAAPASLAQRRRAGPHGLQVRAHRVEPRRLVQGPVLDRELGLRVVAEHEDVL